MKRRVVVSWVDGNPALVQHDNATDVVIAWMELSQHLVNELGAQFSPPVLAQVDRAFHAVKAYADAKAAGEVRS